MDGSSLRSRIRRFPVVQQRSPGQFVVTRSQDKTIVDRCTCFMCGKQFAKRKLLKRHFTACAKDNSKHETLSSESDELSNESNEYRHGQNNRECENIIEPEVLPDKNTKMKPNAELNVTRNIQEIISTQERVSIKYNGDINVKTDKLSKDEEQKILIDKHKRHNRYGDHNQPEKGAIPSDAEDKYDMTHSNTDDINKDTNAKRKRPREIETSYNQYRRNVSKKMKTENESVESNDKNGKVLNGFGKSKMCPKISRPFSSIFGCTLCDASFSNQIALLNHYRRHMDKNGGSKKRESHRDFAKVFDSSLFDQDRSDVADKEVKDSNDVVDGKRRNFEVYPTSYDVGSTSNYRQLQSEDKNNKEIIHKVSRNIKQDIDNKTIKIEEYPNDNKGRTILQDRSNDDEMLRDYSRIGPYGHIKSRYEFTDVRLENDFHFETVTKRIKRTNNVLQLSQSICKENIDIVEKPKRKGDDMVMKERKEKYQTTHAQDGLFDNINVNEVMFHLRRNLTAMSTP